MIYNENGDPDFQFPNNGVASTATFFNGDDAIVLTRDGVVVDSIGRVGEDPGSEWLDPNDPNFSTKEKTIRRKESVTTGDIIIDDEFPGDDNEWVTFPQNTSNGFGCPGEAACGGGDVIDPSEVENFILITEYVEGSASNKAIELSNIGETEIDLLAERYRLAAYNNGSRTETNALNLFGKLPPGSSIVVYNRDADELFKKDAPQGIGSNVTFYNGDDAIVLTKDGVPVDSLGLVGEDPGDFWTDVNDENFATQDKTIRRKAGITQGDYTLDDAFPGETNEWITLEIDTADGLGCIGEGACTGTEPQVIAGDGGVTFGDCVNCAEISKVAVSNMYSGAETFYAGISELHPLDRVEPLNQLLKGGHVALTYSQVWSVLTFSDEDPADSNNVIELYTGTSIAKNMNGSGDNQGSGSWNREHVWPKSFGFPDVTKQVAYTDAHNLRPADWNMNTERSNLNFDNGGQPTNASPINFKDDDSFEPRDEVKGDVARMVFYMASRYKGAAGTDQTANLVLVDSISENTSPNADGIVNFGKLCSLYQWHINDPVSEAEIRRNEVVFEYQGNRNPFIDNRLIIMNDNNTPDDVSDDFEMPIDASSEAYAAWLKESDWAKYSHAWDCFEHNAPVAQLIGPENTSENQMVTIDASNWTDADEHHLQPGIDYKWILPENLEVEIDDTANTISFYAPFITEDTEYAITLQLTDYERVMGEQTFTFTTENTNQTAPEINISGPVAVDEGQTVSIDASGSVDADGYPISYHWKQTTNSHISFQFDSAGISFTAPRVNADTPITFELTITDGEYETVETYTVVIEDTTESDDIIGGGSLGFISLLLLPLVAIRRRVLK